MTDLTKPFQLNQFVIYPQNDQIFYKQTHHKLEPKVMQVLMTLIRNRNRVVSVEELLDEIWEGLVVTPKSAQRSISVLRKVFADDKETYIKTFSKRGYQFVIEPVPLEMNPPNFVMLSVRHVALLALLFLTLFMVSAWGIIHALSCE
ncbi:winged helix-turn-helix domain-containing protein [Echinimonas agarilytica]|uniref:Winged helix-turn-helix domain-containing protein n=1 Tax=Echinimonas agarilytica TaxID=1215918 RepID=A0AA42B6F8_9GAMM|nr:winged helix-turn-helix domain-containing protein [Echinimonas agarilytica]MCM2678712.1 winged helix-turn-helix domain-containing protein [Echinimonas agarilytica]